MSVKQVKDRALVAQRMKAHVAGEDQTPLLIFPEGTCVNNEYCVMFKVRRTRGLTLMTLTYILTPHRPFCTEALDEQHIVVVTLHTGKLDGSCRIACSAFTYCSTTFIGSQLEGSTLQHNSGISFKPYPQS